MNNEITKQAFLDELEKIAEETKKLRHRRFKALPDTTFISGPESKVQESLRQQARKQTLIKAVIGYYPKEMRKSIIRKADDTLKAFNIGGTIRRKGGKKHSYIDENYIKKNPGMFREVVMHEKFHTKPIIGQSETLAHLYGGAFNKSKGSMGRSYAHVWRSRPARAFIEHGAAAIGAAGIVKGIKAITKPEPTGLQSVIQTLKNNKGKAGLAAAGSLGAIALMNKTAAGLYDARKFGKERLDMMEDSARIGHQIRADRAARTLRTPSINDTQVVARPVSNRADLTDTSKSFKPKPI